MLRAQLSPADLSDTIEKNNTSSTEITNLVFSGDELTLIRLTSLSTVSTDSSSTLPAEMELNSPQCSPASSPRTQPISVELSRLQDQFCQLEKEQADAIEKKGWRKQELTAAVNSLHSSYAILLMERLLVPRFGVPLKIDAEAKLSEEPAADVILLPCAAELTREDTWAGTGNERFPKRSNTINPADALNMKSRIFDKLVKEDHIRSVLAASDNHIGDLAEEIKDTEAKIAREKCRISADQNAAYAHNNYAFYQLREITPADTDTQNSKRQRRSGPTQ